MKSTKRLSLLALAMILAGSAQAKPPSILTDIGPVQAIVADITKGVSTPKQLIPHQVSPHDFALRPSDIRHLQLADFIIWIGPRAQPGVAKIMAEPNIQSKSLQLSNVPGLTVLGLRAAGLGAGLKGTEIDPHLWLSPKNASLWVSEITRYLSQLDPENAGIYQTNATALHAALKAATTDIQSRLAPFSSAGFVQYHDAYQYFEAQFGLTPIALVTTGDDEIASLKTVATIRTALRQHSKTCVFVQVSAHPDQAKALLDGEKTQTGRLISPTTSGLSYPQFLRDIAQGYLDCFSPSK